MENVYNEFGKEPSPEMLEYYTQLLLDREIHASDIREKLLSEIGNEWNWRYILKDAFENLIQNW